MNMHVRLSSWAGLILLASCSTRPPEEVPIEKPDSGTINGDVPINPMDRPVTVCLPGRTYCSGSMSYQCNAEGQVINETQCTGAMSTCVENVGCRACVPNMTRCDPMNPQRLQTCRADGSGFDSGATCNANNGETCNAGRCVSRCDESAVGRSYLGCDYWPTVTSNSQLDTQFQFAVVLSNPQSYPVHASITGGALTAPREIDLMPGAIQTEVLPWVLELSQGNPAIPGCRANENCRGNTPGRSALRRRGAYHVHTNGPIAAYQFNPLTFSRQSNTFFSYTNDASLLLPQGVLTQRYTVSTWPNWTPTGATITLGGFVTIVAVTGESTQVVVRPTAQVTPGEGVPAIPAGGVGMFSLQPGDAVQLVSTGVGDLTGTTIEANLPVAVFVGHDCTNVPNARPACDHLEEQLFPNETWGRDYAVTSLRDRGTNNPSVIRIVSQLDNNTLTFTPPVQPSQTLRAGQMLEFATTQHFRVTGTRAFLVAQYMVGQGPAMVGVEGAGDPAMVFEVPVQQYRTQYDFYVPDTYPSNFLNVVAPTGTVLTMDNQPLRGSMEALGGFTVYTLPIQAGPHRIRSGASQQFGIKVYGIARYTSYMYPGGLDLNILPPG